jgi:hypothetical protein
VGQGVPELADALAYALAASDAGLFAGLRDGRILRSGDGGETWTALPARLDALSALAVLPI